MMVFEGESLNFPLPYLVGGEFVAPDGGGGRLKLYDHSGAELINAAVTGVDYEIPASHHQIGGGRIFEKRTLVLSFQYEGRNYTHRSSYRILPFVNYSAGPEDVRSFIGVGAEELPDTAIDIFKAYVDLAERITSAGLESALVSGGRRELLANECLTMLAVLDVVPSLMQRISQMEADGILQVKRHVVKDYNALAEAASARLAANITELSSGGTAAPSIAIIGKVDEPDVITGA